MNCSQSNQVHRYHDGELPAGERARMEAHFLDCLECRELLAGLRSLSSAIAHAALSELPAGGVERLHASWHRARERGVIRLAGWLTAAAAVLILVLLPRSSSNRVEIAQIPFWQTVATIPPTEAQEDNGSDLFLMAQWMADELSQTPR